jgi:O-antigen/teichoic acid export membrane protein
LHTQTARLFPLAAVALGRSYLLSLSGEALQSGFHFVLNLALIRAMTAYQYGTFAIVFILGGISLTYGNALVSVPAAVHIPKWKSSGAVNFQDVVFGSFAVVIAVLIAVIVAIGLCLTIAQPAESVAAGAFVGLWTLRNHLRASLFARRAMVLVTLSDISYAASSVVLIGALFLHQSGAPELGAILSILALANAIAITVALRGRRAPIRISLRRGVRNRYRAIWSDIYWSFIGVTTWNIQGQAPMFLVAAIVGPAAYAPIAAGMVLFNPPRTALGAFVNVVRPEFSANLMQGRYQQAKATLLSSSAVIVSSCLMFGAAIWLGWDFLNANIYGDRFPNASMPLIVALAGLSALIYLSYHVPLSLVHAARGFKAVATATILGAVVGLISTAIAVLVLGVSWSLAGVAAGEMVCWLYLWCAAMRVLSRAAQGTPPLSAFEPAAMAIERQRPGRGLDP